MPPSGVNQFQPLVSRISFFSESHRPNLVNVGEGWKETGPVNLKLCLSAQLPLYWSTLVENHGLRVGSNTHPHPIHFTLSYKLLQGILKVMAWRGHQNHAKSRDAPLSFPNLTPFFPWLHLEILSMKITNKISDKW